MCGRFIQIVDPEQIRVEFSDLEVDEDAVTRFTQSFNKTPTQDILTVVNTPVPRLILTRWGLIPSWAKDRSIGNRMINAKCETLAQKPSFREPLKRSRCIIPVTGFYEWDTSGKVKTPYFIRFRNGRSIALAGLWDRWRDRETGDTIVSSTVITTEPNGLIGRIHDRMPAILSPEDFGLWLSPAPQHEEALLRCLRPCPDGEMEAYAVSRLVNDPRMDSPDLIMPV